MAKRRRRDDERKLGKHERQKQKQYKSYEHESDADDDYMPERRRSTREYKRSRQRSMDVMVIVVAIIIVATVIGGYYFFMIYPKESSGSEDDLNIQPSGSNTVVTIEVEDYGVIRAELYMDKAPITANNFLDLAKQGNYDGCLFHRVMENFMVQGGDFTNFDGTGGHAAEYHEDSGNPSATPDDPNSWVIPDEFHPELRNVRGTLSMANSGPNTGGSQFFINVFDNSHLDDKHTVFGKVISGLEIADEISNIVDKDSNNRPYTDVLITRVYES